MQAQDTRDRHGRRPARIPRRLDQLVASGRISAEEAQRLRAATGGGELDAAIAAIRARHAAAALEAAVGSGKVSREEVSEILDRIRSGEHSSELRTGIRRLARGGALEEGDLGGAADSEGGRSA